MAVKLSTGRVALIGAAALAVVSIGYNVTRDLLGIADEAAAAPAVVASRLPIRKQPFVACRSGWEPIPRTRKVGRC